MCTLLAVLLVGLTGCPNDEKPDVVQPDDDTSGFDTSMDIPTFPDADGSDNGDSTDDPGDGTNGGGDATDTDNKLPDGGCAGCSIGSTKCTSSGQSVTCKPDEDGCGEWGEPTACMGDKVCVRGFCEDANPCNTDSNECSSNAECSPDSNNQKGYTCSCRARYTDYLGDGTICLLDSYSVVSAGTFQMGSPGDETGRSKDESQHQVEISRPIAVLEHEVVQADWGAVVKNDAPWANDKLCDETVCPVYNVSWWDALHYTNELSTQQGLETCYDLKGCSGTPGNDYKCDSVDFKGLDCKGWRLPTEAEWEYATRAGTQTATFDGDISSATTDATVAGIGWYQGNADGKPHVHVQKKTNDWGLADTSGNVAEWVWDYYGSYPNGKQTDPTGPQSGSERVVRGGHWDSPAGACRSAARAKQAPDTRNNKTGFRPVRTLPPKNN